MQCLLYLSEKYFLLFSVYCLACLSSSASLTSSNLLCLCRNMPYCSMSLIQCFSYVFKFTVSMSQYALLHCVSHPMFPYNVFKNLCLCRSMPYCSVSLIQCFSHVFTFTVSLHVAYASHAMLLLCLHIYISTVLCCSMLQYAFL
jgi:hypothetical protein